ncbi:hypothetical protein F4561_003359 [Lipingzhangella halophila]|uniref:Uncharacterized protein n=1 Tax=Lipingzhangella halophila TaxID=1783352 RepID=A0A7W7RID6_9ACTN|nr:hypothetical protein [Lipingzhangella halophila]MBB4932539.1 hypothetical protein [Lipingzhangella halophila]
MDTTETRIRIRPSTVTLAGILQLLFAAGFLIAPLAGVVYGADVQAAAEAELARQGLDPAVLAQNNIHFDEGGYALFLPVGTAVVAALLAGLNLAGKRAGWVLTLVIQPLFLVLDIFILISEASRVEYLQSFLGAGADAQAVINAASNVYPGWLLAVTDVRQLCTFAASATVVVLLLLPSARAFFRKGA